MSRIEELIAELCPEGVAFKPLGEVSDIKRGTSITKSAVTPGEIPVIAGGRTPAYFHNVSNRDGATIVIAGSGAYAGFVSWWDQPTFVSDAFSIKPQDTLLAKYCYYWLTSIQQTLHELKSGGGVPHVYPRDVSTLRIPVPPLDIQREIVKVLDTFKELEAELEAELRAELEARRWQYKYYRDALFAFSDQDIRWAAMAEVGEFFRGRRFTKADYADAGVPCVHYGEIYTQYGTATETTVSHVRADFASTLRFAKQGDLIIAGVGETVEDVGKAVAWIGSGEVAIHDDCFAFRHSLNPRFVSYYFQTTAFHTEKNKFVARAKVKRLSAESLAKLTIPLPSPEEQARIVAILDKFDSLVNEILIGLPAEIGVRRQQYAHYRDRLLTFKEAT